MESFVQYCKDYILNHIDDFEGTSEYGCDWSYKLTQSPNIDGTLTYSRYDASQYLNEWWDECGEYWEYEKDNFGEHMHNPFDDPEVYMVCMVIEGVSIILSNEPHIEESWNESLELTADVVSAIKEYVEEWSGNIF